MFMLLSLFACNASLSLLNPGDSVLTRPGFEGAEHTTTADGISAGSDGALWAVTLQDPYVFALDGSSAALEINVASPEAPIVQSDGGIVVRDDDDVAAFDAQGNELWRTPSPGTPLTRLAERSDGSLVGGALVMNNGAPGGFALFALSSEGEELGRATLPDQPREALAVGLDDTTYVWSDDLFAFDADLEQRWRVTLPATLDTLAVDSSRVYAHTVTNALVALDVATGDTLWTAVGVGGHPVLASGDRLFVTSDDEANPGVWVLDARDGEVLAETPLACLGGAVGSDDHLYTACQFPSVFPEADFPNGLPFVPTVVSPAAIAEVPDYSPERGTPHLGPAPTGDIVVLLDEEAWFLGGTSALHFSTRTTPGTTAWSNQRGNSTRSGRSR